MTLTAYAQSHNRYAQSKKKRYLELLLDTLRSILLPYGTGEPCRNTRINVHTNKARKSSTSEQFRVTLGSVHIDACTRGVILPYEHQLLCGDAKGMRE